MSPIRLVSALTFLVVASASAHAASPSPATDVPGLAGVQRVLPKLELNLTAVDYAIKDRRDPLARTFPVAEATGSHPRPATTSTSSYRRLLPHAIDDRGIGYRMWF